jgi:hypothetical protein
MKAEIISSLDEVQAQFYQDMNCTALGNSLVMVEDALCVKFLYFYLI